MRKHKITMRFFYTWLLIGLGLATPLWSQTLINWPLTTTTLGNATAQIDEVIGFPFIRGNGLSALTYSGSGVNAESWPTFTGEEAQVDYYEFGVKSVPDHTLDLSELSFREKRSSNGPRAFRLFVSRDEFVTQTEVVEVALPDDISYRSHSIPLGLKIQDGEALHFRLYATAAESTHGSWLIQSNSLQIAGTKMFNCVPPDAAANLELSEVTETTATVDLTGGNGQARIIVMSPAGEMPAIPYQGDAYAGNLAYGTGDLLGSNTYVIATTTAMEQQLDITNLEPGTDYELAIFEYNTGQMCYASTPMRLPISTICETLVRSVEEVRYTSLDERVAMTWDGPACVEKYLIVGSEQPINGTPAGFSFNDDSAYGDGSEVAGLGEETYALFFGQAFYNRLLVSNLENGTNYHFAVYVLWNGQWSNAYTFQSQPEDSCPGQFYERIFINEIHYVNGPISQDQGVEIAGPAGIDLSNYELVLFERAGSSPILLQEVHRCALAGLIDDEGAGLGAVWFPLAAMPESRGAVQLVNTITGELTDIVHYDPFFGIRDIFSAQGSGQQGPDQALRESNTDPVGYSIQRIGEGTCAYDFTWARLPHSRGFLNLGQAVLPVELNYLAAEPIGKTSRVYWQTNIESGSDYFIVERSTDGRTFIKIGEVTAAGFSQAIKDYEYYDVNPATGLNYYRLLQVDYDGMIHDEGIVTVRFENGTKPPMNVFPNPVKDRATISWSQTEAVSLKVLDAQGRTLMEWTLEESRTGGSRILDLSSYSPGIYFVRLASRNDQETQRVIKY